MLDTCQKYLLLPYRKVPPHTRPEKYPSIRQIHRAAAVHITCQNLIGDEFNPGTFEGTST